MNLKIRKFKGEDALEVSNLICNCFLKINRNDYSDSVIKIMCSKNTKEQVIKNSNRRMILVCEDEKTKQIVGTGSIENNYIIGIATHIEHQRKGIAKLILVELEKIAKENNVAVLKLHSNPSAVEFYGKYGFIKFKEIYGKKYEHNIFMIKELDED